MSSSQSPAAGRIARAALIVLSSAATIPLAAAPSGDDPGLSAGRDFHALTPQLAWMIDVAISANPDLDAARAEVRAGRARVDRERAFPDPMAGYRYFGGPPETRVGPQVQSLELTQRLPWRGKRELQGRRAALQADAAEAGVLDRERGLVAEIKRSYFEVTFLREALENNRTESELLQRFEEIALKRYATGEGIQQSVIRVQTEISRLADEAIGLEMRVDHLTHGIARLLGDPTRPIAIDPVSLPLLDLDVGHLGRDPAVLAGHTRTRWLRHRIEAEKTLARRRELDGVPDVSVGFGYTQVDDREDAAGLLNPPQGNGDDIWSVGVQFSIPLYRRKLRAGVVEAREAERAAERGLRAFEDGLSHEIHGAVLRVQSIEQRARLHEDVIVPQAEESLASAEAAYTTGRLGFLDLLDAERVLFRARLASHRLRADYWIALADLEFALGSPFPRTLHHGEPQP